MIYYENMAKQSFPKVTIVIPTYNRECYMKACLDSIFKQNYPKNKIEVLIVDSVTTTDNTRKIARNYPVKIIDNPKILAEHAKTLGIKHATGEFFFYLDSDAELVSNTWLTDMINPLVKDPSLAGSFTRFMVKPTQTAFNRFVSFNPLQLWPMLAFLLPTIEQVTIEKSENYNIVKIDPHYTIPIGMGIFRKKWLDKIVKDPDKFIYVDIAIPIQLAELGHDKFAYVPTAGFYHESKSLWHQAKRLRRDVVVTYLPVVGERKFHYVNFSNPWDLLKIVGWIAYVNLLIPSLIVGIYKTIKYRDWAGMYELPTNFILTNYVIWLFLTQKNGWALLKSIFSRTSITSIKSQQLDFKSGSKFSI